jgi:TPR repeat protein
VIAGPEVRDRGDDVASVRSGLLRPDNQTLPVAVEGASAAVKMEMPHSVAVALPPTARPQSQAANEASPPKDDVVRRPAPMPPSGEAGASAAIGASSGGENAAARSAVSETTVETSTRTAPTNDTAPSSSAAPALPAPANPRLPAAAIAELLERGDALLSTGDVTSARLFYERAADAGDGRGALRVGATFDPTFLGRVGLRNVRADQAEARSWYTRALDLGTAEAARQLKSLEKR